MPLIQTALKAFAYRLGFSLRRLRPGPAQSKSSGSDSFEGKIRPLLHRTDPYEGFDPSPWPDDLSGWGSESPAFGELVTLLRPTRIIEVGTWKGASAMTFARHVADAGLDCEILCVDTWLGAIEMWMDLEDNSRYGSLALRNGYPTLYYTFLANVVRARHQERITPFPVPSITAAQWCSVRGVRADLIYIDGSHEEEDVYQDLVSWWDIVRPGGCLVGDDWGWDGVRLAATRFAAESRLTIAHRHDKWEIRK